MKTFHFDFIKSRNYWLIGYLAIILVGAIIFAIFGANLSIDFKGGTMFTYSFTGEVKLSDAEACIKDAIKTDVNVTESTGYNTEAKKLVVTLTSDSSLSAELQNKMLTALTEKFKDNNIAISDSNSVSPTVAGTFFLKCLVAVVLASILVIIYIGFRFRKIGGVSAGVFALVALVLDCLVAFVSCVFFRLEIDSNFMSVILTILGYSLNDTIVIYDRLRENTKMYPDMDFKDRVNTSINQSLGRTIKTSIATFAAIITVVIVAEIYGLTTLRSFAIPMAVGIVSGCVSSVCLSSPLWYAWQKKSMERKSKKAKAPKKAKNA